MRRVLLLLLAGALVAGCGDMQTVKENVRQVRDLLRKLRGKEPAPPPPAPPSTAEMPAQAAAGLTLAGNCSGRDETGYAESLRMDIAGGQVRQFDLRIDIPKRGSCSYKLADFRQSKQAPYVELLARSGSACAIRAWQQGDRVTVAATDCQEKCATGAFEYAWPVELQAPGGGCYP